MVTIQASTEAVGRLLKETHQGLLVSIVEHSIIVGFVATSASSTTTSAFCGRDGGRHELSRPHAIPGGTRRSFSRAGAAEGDRVVLPAKLPGASSDAVTKGKVPAMANLTLARETFRNGFDASLVGSLLLSWPRLLLGH